MKWLRQKYRKLGWVMAGRPSVTAGAGSTVIGCQFSNVGIVLEGPETTFSNNTVRNEMGVGIRVTSRERKSPDL